MFFSAGEGEQLPQRPANPEVQFGAGRREIQPRLRLPARIPVYLLLQKMAAGETEADLLRTYPQLTASDLQACLDQSSQALASVKQGLKESAEGKRIYRGFFAKHAKE